ncbi:hypothetical protein HK101_006170, partial [Irineochytrium annulatum]
MAICGPLLPLLMRPCRPGIHAAVALRSTIWPGLSRETRPWPPIPNRHLATEIPRPRQIPPKESRSPNFAFTIAAATATAAAALALSRSSSPESEPRPLSADRPPPPNLQASRPRPSTTRVILRVLRLAVLILPLLLLLPFHLISGRQSTWYANLLARRLELAGPLWIKLAQWGSVRPDVLSREVCEALGRLRCRVAPHGMAETRSAIAEAFEGVVDEGGDVLDSLFEEFAEEPVGVGAVGQVYKARLRKEVVSRINPGVAASHLEGVDVAVKVLHPHIDPVIEVDLELLRLGAKAAASVIKDSEYLAIEEEIGTFAEMMWRQVDLRIEADNLE